MDESSEERSSSVSRIARMMARGPDNMSMSYGRAARLLLDAGRQPDQKNGVHLDLPSFFCLRHSVELALKDLLWLHHRNETERRRLQDGRGEPVTAKPLGLDVLNELRRTHDLQWLIDRVREHLPIYWKPEWDRLVQRILKLEGPHHDWSRYDGSRIPKAKLVDGRRWEYRFDRPVEVPVNDLIEDLEIFLRGAVALDVDDLYGEKSVLSAAQDLAVTSLGIDQDLQRAGLYEM